MGSIANISFLALLLVASIFNCFVSAQPIDVVSGGELEFHVRWDTYWTRSMVNKILTGEKLLMRLGKGLRTLRERASLESSGTSSITNGRMSFTLIRSAAG